MTVTTPPTTEAPQPKYRKDYLPPAFFIETVELEFELGEDGTTVRSRMAFVRNEAAGTPAAPLVLDGEELETLEVGIDGAALDATRWTATADQLTVTDVPERFTLETVVRIHPESNTALMGLYRSSGNFCTQCEAEGFRKITWYPRPARRDGEVPRHDASPRSAKYPVLLSNGNRVASRTSTGRPPSRSHWEDPFPKPSYLFALVAGDL